LPGVVHPSSTVCTLIVCSFLLFLLASFLALRSAFLARRSSFVSLLFCASFACFFVAFARALCCATSSAAFLAAFSAFFILLASRLARLSSFVSLPRRCPSRSSLVGVASVDSA